MSLKKLVNTANIKCVCVFCIECGGKMHLREGEFSRAHTDFFEAFKNYDESGSPRLEQSHTSHTLPLSLFPPLL